MGNHLDDSNRTTLDPKVHEASPGKSHQRTELINPEKPEATADVEARLVFISGSRDGGLVRIRGASLLIGSAHGCDLKIDDTAISAQHAKIRRTSEGAETVFEIHDLATDNGTRVNEIAQKTTILTNNDVIEIGRTKLVFKRL